MNDSAEQQVTLWGEFLSERFDSVAEYREWLGSQAAPDEMVEDLVVRAEEQAEEWGWVDRFLEAAIDA